MGLAKLVVDVQSLLTMLLDEEEARRWKASNTETLPSDASILTVSFEDGDLVYVLNHTSLPEVDGRLSDISILRSKAEFMAFEVTEDQQDRLNMYEQVLGNVMELASLAPGLTLKVFNEKLKLLATKAQAAMRKDNIEDVLTKAQMEDTFKNE
jgi:hypothetical protein